VLVGKDGKIDGFIMLVGGFLGIDEKNVAVPFDAVTASQKKGSWRLTINATKDQLEKAPAFKYDRAKATSTYVRLVFNSVAIRFFEIFFRAEACR